MRLVGVGVGPGDPELVTVKAVRVLREADLVFVPVGDPASRAAPSDRARARRAAPSAWSSPSTTGRRHRAPREPGTPPAERSPTRSATGPARSRSRRSATRTSTPPSPTSPRPCASCCPACEVETVPGITAMQDLAARPAPCWSRAPSADAAAADRRRRPAARGAGRRRHRRRLQGRPGRWPRCSTRSATPDGSDGAVFGARSGCPTRTSGPPPSWTARRRRTCPP